MSVQGKDDVLGSAEGLHQLTSNLDNSIKRRGGSVDFSNRLTQATVFLLHPRLTTFLPAAQRHDRRMGHVLVFLGGTLYSNFQILEVIEQNKDILNNFGQFFVFSF